MAGPAIQVMESASLLLPFVESDKLSWEPLFLKVEFVMICLALYNTYQLNYEQEIKPLCRMQPASSLDAEERKHHKSISPTTTSQLSDKFAKIGFPVYEHQG